MGVLWTDPLSGVNVVAYIWSQFPNKGTPQAKKQIPISNQSKPLFRLAFDRNIFPIL